MQYNFLKFFCVNLCAVAFVYIGLGLLDTSFDRLAGIALGEVLCLMITFYGCSKYFSFAINFSYLKRAVNLSLPLIPGAIAMIFSALSDRYFLVQSFGASAVAEYNLALQFLIPMQMIMVGAQTAWAPHVFSIKKEAAAYRASVDFAIKISALLILIVILMAVCIYVAKVVGLIPEYYKDTLWLFLALSIVTVEIILFQIPNNLLIISGKTHWISAILIPSSALTILGGYFFVSKYGYFIGALNGGVIYGFALLVGWVLVRKALVDETNEGAGQSKKRDESVPVSSIEFSLGAKAFRAYLTSRMGVESIPVSQLVYQGNLDLKLQNATQAEGQTSYLELLCILANVKGHILPGQNFLEIGTYDGNTALKFALNLSEGSKNFTIHLPYEDSSTASFTYDDALAKNPQRQKKKQLAMDNVTQIFADSTKFDVRETDIHGAFIDGGHDFESVKADAINVLTSIQRSGFVIWHDYEVECEIGDVLHALIPQFKFKHIEGTRMGFLYLST